MIAGLNGFRQDGVRYDACRQVHRSHPSDVQERDGKGRWCGKMISVETYMKDYEASVPENLQGEWTRLMRRQSLLMLEWTAFYPSGATHRQPDYTDFYLPLIADFWGRILVRRQIR